MRRLRYGDHWKVLEAHESRGETIPLDCSFGGTANFDVSVLDRKFAVRGLRCFMSEGSETVASLGLIHPLYVFGNELSSSICHRSHVRLFSRIGTSHQSQIAPYMEGPVWRR